VLQGEPQLADAAPRPGAALPPDARRALLHAQPALPHARRAAPHVQLALPHVRLQRVRRDWQHAQHFALRLLAGAPRSRRDGPQPEHLAWLQHDRPLPTVRWSP
jgi:hypothetical protein